MNHYWSRSFRGYCCFYLRTPPAPTISRTSSTLSNSLLPFLSPVLTEVSSMPPMLVALTSECWCTMFPSLPSNLLVSALRLQCAHRERPIHHHHRPNRYHDMLFPYPVRIFPSHLLTGTHTPKTVVTTGNSISSVVAELSVLSSSSVSTST